MHITKFEAENIKRITAVNIEPDGNMVILGGNNKQGKSSCLDAISYAIGGKKLIPNEPLRNGSQAGKVSITLAPKNAKDDALVVTRKFTDKGTTSLTITAADGKAVTSPQSILENLVGSFTLDPHALINASPKEQVKMVKDVLKLDFSALEQEKEKVYQERTFKNREAAQLNAAINEFSKINEKFDTVKFKIPNEEVSVADLIKKLEWANSQNHKITLLKNEITKNKENAKKNEEEAREVQSQIERLSSIKHKLEGDRINIYHEALGYDKQLDNIKEINTEEIVAQINSVDELNARIRAIKENQEREAQLRIKETEAANLTARLKAIDDEKLQQIKSANFPVSDLSFDENGLRLNNLPFEQASQAEQLETAIALALAENPPLRVIWIKDASLMDHKSLKLMASIAEKYDAQIWMERTSLGKECSVILTDGHIASDLEAEFLRLEESA